MNTLPDRQRSRAGFAVAVLVVVSLPSVATGLTSTMQSHVLILIPLLVAVGVGFGRCLAPALDGFLDRWNGGGIPGILVTTFTIAFWMIPRWLDASLTNSVVEWSKHGSLILLAGVPLALSWDRLHPVARGVVKIEFLSMLFRLGWLYLISPERFCNNYLLNDQIWLGRGMIIIGIALSITWLIPVFFGEITRPVAKDTTAVMQVGVPDVR